MANQRSNQEGGIASLCFQKSIKQKMNIPMVIKSSGKFYSNQAILQETRVEKEKQQSQKTIHKRPERNQKFRVDRLKSQIKTQPLQLAANGSELKEQAEKYNQRQNYQQRAAESDTESNPINKIHSCSSFDSRNSSLLLVLTEELIKIYDTHNKQQSFKEGIEQKLKKLEQILSAFKGIAQALIQILNHQHRPLQIKMSNEINTPQVQVSAQILSYQQDLTYQLFEKTGDLYHYKQNKHSIREVLRLQNYLLRTTKTISLKLSGLKNIPQSQVLFLTLCLRHLQLYMNFKFNLVQAGFIIQIQKLLAQLKIWQEKIFRKYQYSVEIRNNYIAICNSQHLGFYEFKKLFIQTFIKQSYVLLSLNAQAWKNMATLVLGQQINDKRKVDQFIGLLKTYYKQFLQKKEKNNLEQFERNLQIYKKEWEKVNLFLQRTKRKQSKFNNLVRRYGCAKFKTPPNVETLMLLQINFDLITLVHESQAYESPFLLFLVPFTYLLAETLAYYDSESAKNSTIFSLFSQLIKKINFKKNMKNSELKQSQLIDHLVNFVNYIKFTPNEICSMMGKFLIQHGNKMKGFIPVYYEILHFYAFEKYEFIKQINKISDIRSKRSILLQRIQHIYQNCRQKYHNRKI